MHRIWCVRKGVNRGFYNELVACVACHCRHRKRCQPYAELPLERLAEANAAARRHGHAVHEEYPLFEANR